MKQNILPLIILAAAIIAGMAYVSHKRSQVSYADTPCPLCSSHEVLDFGTNADGSQQAHCPDCNTDFTIENI